MGDTANTNAAPDYVQMAVAPDGTLHVVWAEFLLPSGWPPLGLYYAQSTDGGATWTRRRVAGDGYNQPSVVLGPGSEVYLTWTGIAGEGGKYFEESLDGGRTWLDTVAVLPARTGGGSEGRPNLVVDSNGNLHMLYSNLGCAWYVARLVGSWTDPECVSAGSADGDLLEAPTMAISLGHRLDVLYWTGRRQIWHTSLLLDSPAITPAAVPILPTPTVAPITATPAPTLTPTPLPDYGPLPTSADVTQPGMLSLAAGVAPVALLLLIALFRQRRRRYR